MDATGGLEWSCEGLQRRKVVLLFGTLGLLRRAKCWFMKTLALEFGRLCCCIRATVFGGFLGLGAQWLRSVKGSKKIFSFSLTPPL